MRRMFYLGVEGGATKSTAILVDERGKKIGERKGKALNWHNEGKEGARRNLNALLAPLLKKKGVRTLGGVAVFGFAGLDTARAERIYKEMARSVLPPSFQFYVVNDALIALEARCPGKEAAILVISGTGSSVYGRSRARVAKSIGWGFVMGDEGSGYEAGRKVITYAVRAWDGRCRKTVLQALAMKHARARTMEKFIEKVYQKTEESRQNSKAYIASFAPLVDKGIAENDWAALHIREETASALAEGFFAVASRLRLKKKEFCVGLVGSQWKMPGLKERFARLVKKRYLGARFSQRSESGAWGAIAIAKQLQKQKTKNKKPKIETQT